MCDSSFHQFFLNHCISMFRHKGVFFPYAFDRRSLCKPFTIVLAQRWHNFSSSAIMMTTSIYEDHIVAARKQQDQVLALPSNVRPSSDTPRANSGNLDVSSTFAKESIPKRKTIRRNVWDHSYAHRDVPDNDGPKSYKQDNTLLAQMPKAHK